MLQSLARMLSKGHRPAIKENDISLAHPGASAGNRGSLETRRGPYRILLSIALLLLSLWGLMSIAALQDPIISDVQLSINEREFTPARLPLRQNISGAYRVTMSFNPRNQSSYAVQIIPDDELLALSVNGEPVSLAAYSRNQLRDYNRGIILTLQDLRSNEDNLLEFSLTNSSNPAGLAVRPLHSSSPLAMLGVFAALLLAGYALYRHIKLTPMQRLMFIVGIVASLIYLLHTDPRTRTFDVYEGGGHRDYIHYLINERAPPPPGEGWEYHQPPLYYLIAAVANAGIAPADLHSDYWGQLLALWFWCIFLVASLGTLNRSLGKRGWALLLASISVCLWPAGLIHSIRIGNDVPLYAFYALAFYYCVVWWKSRASNDLFWAAIWASAALLTKSNALAIWGVIGILYLVESYRLFSKPANPLARKKIITNFVILAVCFVVTLALNFGDNIWHYLEGRSEDWLLSNVSTTINARLRVANEPFNYLVFDLATFLKYPFISTWDDIYGRQYFWNFVWRSALSSEFSFRGEALAVWGSVNGVLLLIMLAGICLYGIQQQTLLTRGEIHRALMRNLPWYLALVLPFLLLLAYRIKVPLSCNTDFRYIYPVLLPLLFFSALAWRAQPQLKCARAMALGAPLIALSSWLWLIYL